MLWFESESTAPYKLDFFVFRITPSVEARGNETEASGKDKAFLISAANLLWSDFAASNPMIFFCSTISFILPSIFIYVVLFTASSKLFQFSLFIGSKIYLLDAFLLILSLNSTIRIFSLSNIVSRNSLMSSEV